MKRLQTRYKDIEIVFNPIEEHIPIRGNAIVSGDNELDKKVEDELIKRLQRGDIYAWFVAEVWAECNGLESEHEYLGACSYEDADDFIENSGYFDEMKESALDDLINNKMNNICEQYENILRGNQTGLRQRNANQN